jgi:hypothetical protein
VVFVNVRLPLCPTTSEEKNLKKETTQTLRTAVAIVPTTDTVRFVCYATLRNGAELSAGIMAAVDVDAVVKCHMENRYAETRTQLPIQPRSCQKANNFVKKVFLTKTAKWTRVEKWKPLFRFLRSEQAGGNLVDIGTIDLSGITSEDSDPERLMATASSILQKVQGVPALKILNLSASDALS